MFTALSFSVGTVQSPKEAWLLLSFLEKKKVKKFPKEDDTSLNVCVPVNVTDIVIKRYLLKIRAET